MTLAISYAAGLMSRPLRNNALAGAAEQIVVGGAFFLFYGILIRTLGTELVGVLSLILVLASIGSFGGAGFASALSHFVPAYQSRGDQEGAKTCIETTLICTMALYALTLAVAYFPFEGIIAAQAGPEYASLVDALMLPASLHVLMIGIGSTITQALTATQRNDLRLYASTAGAIAGLAVLIALVRDHGVIAGIWGLLAQSATIAAVAWVMLRRVVPELELIPWRLDPPMARKLFGLGANMQVQTLALAGVEPVTRLVIGHFGSLSAVAIFSIANRFVIQMRALIYAGLQPLLSALSHARAESEDAVVALYDRSRGLTFIAAVVCLSAAAGAAPFVGEIWTGNATSGFVLYTTMLCAGWLANTLALPTYFNAYSLGLMRRSLAGHLLLLVLTIALGVPLALVLGSDGAVAGLALALAGSAAFLIVANGAFAPRSRDRTHMGRDALLLAAAAAATAAAIVSYGFLRSYAGPVIAGLGSGAAWAAVIAPALAFHPVSRALWTPTVSRPRAHSREA